MGTEDGIIPEQTPSKIFSPDLAKYLKKESDVGKRYDLNKLGTELRGFVHTNRLSVVEVLRNFAKSHSEFGVESGDQNKESDRQRLTPGELLEMSNYISHRGSDYAIGVGLLLRALDVNDRNVKEIATKLFAGSRMGSSDNQEETMTIEDVAGLRRGAIAELYEHSVMNWYDRHFSNTQSHP